MYDTIPNEILLVISKIDTNNGRKRVSSSLFINVHTSHNLPGHFDISSWVVPRSLYLVGFYKVLGYVPDLKGTLVCCDLDRLRSHSYLRHRGVSDIKSTVFSFEITRNPPFSSLPSRSWRYDSSVEVISCLPSVLLCLPFVKSLFLLVHVVESPHSLD